VVNGSQALVIDVGTNGFGDVCPPNAVSATVAATVTALRTNGQPIGTNILQVGDRFIVQMAVLYFPDDPLSGGVNAAFTDGQMLLSLRGSIVDATPLGGVPVIGPSDCLGVPVFFSLTLTNTVTLEDAEAGSIQISGVYTNGYALLGGPPLPVGSEAQSQLRLGFVIRAIAPPCVICLNRGSPVLMTGPDDPGSGSLTSAECGPLGPNTRWFKMKATDTGFVTISTEGSSINNPLLAIYRGPINSPIPVACNDDVSTNNRQSRVTFRATEDVVYWVVVNPRNGDVSSLRLAVGFEPQINVYGFKADGGFELQTSAGPYIPYTLRASTDIARNPTNWTILLTTNLSENLRTLYYRDDDARDFPRRFYRIGPPP